MKFIYLITLMFLLALIFYSCSTCTIIQLRHEETRDLTKDVFDKDKLNKYKWHDILIGTLFPYKLDKDYYYAFTIRAITKNSNVMNNKIKLLLNYYSLSNNKDLLKEGKINKQLIFKLNRGSVIPEINSFYGAVRVFEKRKFNVFLGDKPVLNLDVTIISNNKKIRKHFTYNLKVVKRTYVITR